MYAAIRQAKAKSGSAEELARRIKDGAVPIISDVDGFRAYYVVYAGDDTVTAISIFDKFEQAEEANRRAIAWIEKDLGPLLAGHASAAAGPGDRAYAGVGGRIALASHSTVIARLDRAIQYSETAVIEPISRGVLDAPPAAYAKASAPLDRSRGEALA
ncbi:hypothetical protein ACVWXN_006192 [Bradyrhizobium sp. i1.4.4]